KDTLFLDAYNRVKKNYYEREQKSENSNWNFPNIIVDSSSYIQVNNLKKIGKIYIDYNQIMQIKNSFPAFTQLFLEMIKKDFYNTAPKLKEYQNILNNMNKIRSLNPHGSSFSLEQQLNENKMKYAKKLYFDKENFLQIHKVTDWFMQEISKRIYQLSNES
ncbi:hypothetical protein, partial [Geminocystis sp. GBBB08]|uniref:hypothetical protein n=1 Tax=Geminocystis sp. GBBB08 TaxID=2604140 RepID=UPI0027E37F8F